MRDIISPLQTHSKTSNSGDFDLSKDPNIKTLKSMNAVKAINLIKSYKQENKIDDGKQFVERMKGDTLKLRHNQTSQV